MKKMSAILFLSLSLLTLSACNSKNETTTTKVTDNVSTTDKKKDSASTTSKMSQASSSQVSQAPETPPAEQPSQNQQQVQTPEANYVDPNQANQTPAAEQPVQNEQAQAPATDNWMTPEQRSSLVDGGQFDPNFVDGLSQSDYQAAMDRAQQRLEESGVGDVSLFYYELYKMNPESTTLFDGTTLVE